MALQTNGFKFQADWRDIVVQIIAPIAFGRCLARIEELKRIHYLWPLSCVNASQALYSNMGNEVHTQRPSHNHPQY